MIEGAGEVLKIRGPEKKRRAVYLGREISTREHDTYIQEQEDI